MFMAPPSASAGGLDYDYELELKKLRDDAEKRFEKKVDDLKKDIAS